MNKYILIFGICVSISVSFVVGARIGGEAVAVKLAKYEVGFIAGKLALSKNKELERLEESLRFDLITNLALQSKNRNIKLDVLYPEYADYDKALCLVIGYLERYPDEESKIIEESKNQEVNMFKLIENIKTNCQ